jgi:hypothetical protein
MERRRSTLRSMSKKSSSASLMRSLSTSASWAVGLSTYSSAPSSRMNWKENLPGSPRRGRLARRSYVPAAEVRYSREARRSEIRCSISRSLAVACASRRSPSGPPCLRARSLTCSRRELCCSSCAISSLTSPRHPNTPR